MPPPTPGSARAFILKPLSPQAPSPPGKTTPPLPTSRISASAPLRRMGLHERTFRTLTSAAPLKLIRW